MGTSITKLPTGANLDQGIQDDIEYFKRKLALNPLDKSAKLYFELTKTFTKPKCRKRYSIIRQQK